MSTVPVPDGHDDGFEVVEDGVLRRTVKSDLKLRGAGLRVPHDHTWVRRSDRKILVAGDRAKVAAGDAEELTDVWRAVFHSRVHIALDELVERGALTTAGIRERVDAIGQTEFDEIRSVLRQEHLLIPPADEQVIYLEFVALFCELEAFAPRALEHTFPALHDLAAVRATLRRDIDPEALLAASRPKKAPERPFVELVPEADPYGGTGKLEFADRSARKGAERARKKGNLARAAIYAARAGDMPAARTDLDGLVARLAKTLSIDDPTQTAGWVDALLPVVYFAGTQQSLRLNLGARLLYDLQAACIVFEREVKVVDVVGWALSLGKQKVVRSLPATREVRIAKHLRHASQRVSGCELEHPQDRDRLAAVLHAISKRGDINVRDALRPKIEAALEEVDMNPRSLPERVAEKKLIDELLDRATKVGRLTLGDLRDAISKNDLKMPDLTLTALRKRDQLLGLDKILARSLDGVYRSGEIYLRFLQKLSSIVFGTWVGRILTLYLFLPLLGSFAVVEGMQHMVGPLIKKITGDEPAISTPFTLYAFAAFLFLVLHVRPIRRVVWWIFRMIGRALRFLLWTIPIAVWTHPIARAYMASTVHRWLVRPAIIAAITLLIAGYEDYLGWIIAGGVFAVVAIAFNSELGRRFEERVTDWLVLSGRQFTTRIIPGLVRWTLEVFGKLADVVDRALYRVDEWLRFRQGQSLIKLILKGILGTIWFVIAYVLRLYIDLFIEPTTNPIKHFPVVTVAAKLIIPIIPAIASGVTNATEGLLGPAIAAGFAAFTVIVLPGLAGFLVWELKENWKLYRASRPPTLGPLVIGGHGETMIGFLKPGFHSGTIPKLFTKLRRAAWRGDEKGIAKQHDGLHHVEESIEKFVDRQLVSMLVEVEAFGAKDVALARIDIGSNRVQMTIICPSVGSTPATIRIELQSGWIVGTLSEPGWTSQLDPKQRRIFEIALAGFYKLSGIDLLREQLEHALASDDAPAPPYDIADEGLVVWPGDGFATEAIYDLTSEKLTPVLRGAPYHGALFDLGGRHALFGREPLYWSVWSTTWQQIARGEQPMPIIVGPSLLRAASA
ncbi:MAG: hypothetical protein H0T46_15845 [Deltaproteobacteria bacterium]|nr:hypothetical protein [Deltaproteobacteria bacterium]